MLEFRRTFPGVVCVAILLADCFATALAVAAPRSDELSFEIRRDGTPVGEHRVSFSRAGNLVDVHARSEIAVPFLFFTGYRFSYDSRSLWREERLERLDAVTNDNGASSRVVARRDGDSVAVEGPAGALVASAGTFITEHWDSQVLSARTVLNTITGSVNHVDIVPGDVESIETLSGPRRAQRFTYTGELRVTVWYDDSGRWVGLRFMARDGSRIDYVCRHCDATAILKRGS